MTRLNKRNKLQILMFLLPGVLVVGSVLLYPLLSTFRLGMFSYSISRGMHFIGIDNYIKIFSDEKFYVALRNTVIYTVAVVSVEMLVGFVLANILNRKFFLRNIVRCVLMIPMLTSPIVSGIMWRFMYNPDFGIINYFFSLVGLQPQVWTGSPKTALLSVIIVDIWQFTPFVILLLLAGLQSIPNTQYEAASIDGANFWQGLRYITLPWLKPMILVVLLLRTMDSLKVFDQVYALTGGGPGISSLTVGVYAYTKGFRNFNLGYAAAISWVLAFITILISLFYARIISAPERERN